MYSYLKTLFDEKGISLDTPVNEQKAIKKMIVQIDFRNGDVFDYMKHLSPSNSNLKDI